MTDHANCTIETAIPHAHAPCVDSGALKRMREGPERAYATAAPGAR